jgi:hypothetical protein
LENGPSEPDFTIGDIVSHFREKFGPPKEPILVDPDNCYTTEELALMWGVNQKTVRAELKALKRKGLLIELRKGVEPLGRPGFLYPAPAYQIIGEDKSGED